MVYTEKLLNLKHNFRSYIADKYGELLLQNHNPRAAIVTWCNNNGPTNYGQILQCYAMQTLFQSVGFEAKILLYQSKANSIVEPDFERFCRFQEFINHYIHLTKPCYTKEMAEEETADCDLLVCGSDQIWNPSFFDPVYLLGFGRKDQKRIAVSVSGIFTDSQETKPLYKRIAKEYLENFQYISLRERCGAEILSNYSDKEIHVLSDPTLLLSEEEWSRVAAGNTSEKDYALCYFLGSMQEYYREIIGIAKSCGVDEIYYIPSNLINEAAFHGLKEMNGAGPAEFLALIKNAKAVITDSFHGVCLSHVFQVPCFCAERQQEGAEIFGGKKRINNLQSEFGIPIQWIYPDTPVEKMNSINKTNTPLVSIIMPVYNAAGYLRESLGSVVKQTYHHLEIICVDDGSTDSSLEIIKEYQEKDSRIILIQQEHKLAGIARNHGLEVSSGEYVLFLDADDRFSNTLVEKMVKKAEETQADIVICDYEGFDAETGDKYINCGVSLNKNLIPPVEVFSKKELPDTLYGITGGCVWDKLYRTSFVKENGLRFISTRIMEDARFVFLSYALADRITTIDETLIYYRMYNQASLTGERSDCWRDVFTMLLSLKEELERRGLYKYLEKSYIKMAVDHIAGYLCKISDPDTMGSYCAFYKEHLLPILKTGAIEKNVWEQNPAYKILKQVDNLDLSHTVCQVLYEASKEKDKAIQRDNWVMREQGKAHDSLLHDLKMFQRMKRWNFDPKILKNHPSVIIYGYGDVGKDYCRQLERDKDGKLVLVVDRNYQSYQNEKREVHPVSDITKASFDIILIAVYKQDVADEIRDCLHKMGINDGKIAWFDPDRQCYA